LTKHAPEQLVDPNNGYSIDHTTWSYNPDDTVQSTKDARGVTSTFTYSNRHLLTKVEFGGPGGPGTPLPTGVASTATIQFGYDAAGNRTSMSDGLGSTSYNYNQLSQMTSESRTFTNVGTFPLSYDYNYAGELKKITDS